MNRRSPPPQESRQLYQNRFTLVYKWVIVYCCCLAVDAVLVSAAWGLKSLARSPLVALAAACEGCDQWSKKRGGECPCPPSQSRPDGLDVTRRARYYVHKQSHSPSGFLGRSQAVAAHATIGERGEDFKPCAAGTKVTCHVHKTGLWPLC